MSLTQLEEAPESKARRAVVEEVLAKASAQQDEELLKLAKQLLDAVQAHSPEAAGAIGVDLEDIKGASLSAGRVPSRKTQLKSSQSRTPRKQGTDFILVGLIKSYASRKPGDLDVQ